MGAYKTTFISVWLLTLKWSQLINAVCTLFDYTYARFMVISQEHAQTIWCMLCSTFPTGKHFFLLTPGLELGSPRPGPTRNNWQIRPPGYGTRFSVWTYSLLIYTWLTDSNFINIVFVSSTMKMQPVFLLFSQLHPFNLIGNL